MPRTSRVLLLLLPLLAALGCRIEEHIPSGRLQDEAEIRAVLAKYFDSRARTNGPACAEAIWDGARLSVGTSVKGKDRAPGIIPLDAVQDCAMGTLPFGPLARDARMMRADLRIERDLASAWVQTLSRQALAGYGDLEVNEVIALSRIRGKWRIAAITVTSADGR